LPQRLAGIVERLELDQPRVVTMPELAQIAVETGACAPGGGPSKLVYRLQELGWLGSLRTKGAWEFIPGARAGRYGSGDRFIEFRAQRAAHSEWLGVLAMESAATLLGLAQRLPEREVVALPPGTPRPKALSDWRAVAIDLPAEGRGVHDGLPCWTVNGLLAGVAIRPSGYRDLAGLAQWLPDAGGQLDTDTLSACLTDAPRSAWQRAAYLARVAGAGEVAADLLAARPPETMVWFGATRVGGTYDPVAKVSDADLAPYLEEGVGA
jgi:hypothetical protein